MEHVREKYDFVFNKDKFSLDDYNDSINFGDLPASSPPPSGKILYFIFIIYFLESFTKRAT